MNFRRYGAGPVVVLQHGFLGGGGYWLPQLAEFGRTFDVIAPDLPGFAGSADVPFPDSLAGYAAALIALMDRLEATRFSLVGHSMGGMIAQQLALDYPHRLDKLVLYGTAPSGSLPTRFETHKQTIERFKAQGPQAAADVAASWFVARKDHPFYPFTVAAGAGFKVEAAINAMTIIPPWDVRARLGEIRAPTLVIAADQDYATTPDHAFELWRAIPGSRLCIVPGCSHNIHLEKTDVFNHVVGRFLQTGG